MLSSFKQMTPLLKNIHEGKKFLIMNLVIIVGNNLWEQKPIGWKQFVFSKLWEYDIKCKIKSIYFENKRFRKI